MKNKVLTNQKAKEILTGKSNLVFISGCFDVLHIGHIQLLRQAKGKDREVLVVLHDDESIKIKKGENRPINPLGYRIEVMKELESVDYVTSWQGWETIANFAKELKPGFIAVTKTQHENKTVAKIAAEIGAKLIEIPITVNTSTTEIISKLGL